MKKFSESEQDKYQIRKLKLELTVNDFETRKKPKTLCFELGLFFSAETFVEIYGLDLFFFLCLSAFTDEFVFYEIIQGVK